MKKNLFLFTIAAVAAVVLISCKNNSVGVPDPHSALQTDTAGLAEFQQWKMAEFREWKQQQEQVAYQAPVASSPSKKVTRTADNSGGYMTSSSSHNAKVVKKKGWSKAAKGAAIGVGSGAIAGALIHKRNRVVGAIVGGIIGGGSGYVIGRSQDKKDGRY